MLGSAKQQVLNVRGTAPVFDLKDQYDMLADLAFEGSTESKADEKAVAGSNAETKKVSQLPGTFLLAKRSKMGRSSLPPSLDLSVRFRRTFRFTSTSVTGTSVTVGDLLGCMGTICTTTNTGVTTMSSAVRVRRIIVWPSAASTTTFCDIYFGSQSTGYGPDAEIGRNIPAGVTVTGGLMFKPPKGSLAAFWMDSTLATTVVWYSQISIGSIIDVELEGTLSNTIAPINVSVATGTLAAVYYLALDGPSTNRYPPTNLNTTH